MMSLMERQASRPIRLAPSGKTRSSQSRITSVRPHRISRVTSCNVVAGAANVSMDAEASVTLILYLMKETLILIPIKLQMRSKLTNLDKVTILSEALPFLRKFAGKTIVIKYGGFCYFCWSLLMNFLGILVLYSCNTKAHIKVAVHLCRRSCNEGPHAEGEHYGLLMVKTDNQMDIIPCDRYQCLLLIREDLKALSIHLLGWCDYRHCPAGHCGHSVCFGAWWRSRDQHLAGEGWHYARVQEWLACHWRWAGVIHKYMLMSWELFRVLSWTNNSYLRVPWLWGSPVIQSCNSVPLMYNSCVVITTTWSIMQLGPWRSLRWCWEEGWTSHSFPSSSKLGGSPWGSAGRTEISSRPGR